MLDPSTDMLEKLAGKKIFPIFSGNRMHLASTVVLESTINNNYELLLIKNPFGHAFSFEKFIHQPSEGCGEQSIRDRTEKIRLQLRGCENLTEKMEYSTKIVDG